MSVTGIDGSALRAADETEKKLFLVFPEVFRREVCAGFDWEPVAAELATQNLLVRGDGKNLMKRESVPDLGHFTFFGDEY